MMCTKVISCFFFYIFFTHTVIIHVRILYNLVITSDRLCEYIILCDLNFQEFKIILCFFSFSISIYA